MPLFIEFTPLNKIQEDSKEIDRLLLSVLRMSSLPHQGCEIELRSDAEKIGMVFSQKKPIEQREFMLFYSLQAKADKKKANHGQVEIIHPVVNA